MKLSVCTYTRFIRELFYRSLWRRTDNLGHAINAILDFFMKDLEFEQELNLNGCFKTVVYDHHEDAGMEVQIFMRLHRMQP